MKFRPCIDIHEGKVKQIVGSRLYSGSFNQNFVSNNDACYYAQLYSQYSLGSGHIIMLDNEPETLASAKNAIAAFRNRFLVGGGITNENANYWIESGAESVIVTSFAIRDGKISYPNLDRLVDTIGKEKIVIDLSCQEDNGIFYVASAKWSKTTSIEINYENLKNLSSYCKEFLIHGIDAEGKRKGIKKDLVRLLADLTVLPITYAGGVSSIEDLDLFFRLSKGNLDISIGSALDIFGGSLQLSEVVRWFEIKSVDNHETDR